MHSNETPTFPYCRNGIIWHNGPSGNHVPRMKRYTLNGNTITQNKQSATHKLQPETESNENLKRAKNRLISVFNLKILIKCYLPNNKCGCYISHFWTL